MKRLSAFAVAFSLRLAAVGARSVAVSDMPRTDAQPAAEAQSGPPPPDTDASTPRNHASRGRG